MARGVLAPDHSIPIDVANRLEVEPQTQGFSDRDCGCSWIAPVTCVFRDCKRSSLVVVFGHLDGFCNHKVSKRSAQRDRRQILHTGGRVASPRPGIARPHASPGQPSTEPPASSRRRYALTQRCGSTRPNRPAINSTTASNDATHRARSTMQQSSPPNRPPPLTTRQTAVAVPVRRRLGSPSSIAELVLSEIKLILAKLTQGPAVMADRRYPLPAAPKSDHA